MSTWRDDLGDRLAGALTRLFDDAEVEVYASAQALTTPEWWEEAYKGGEPVGPAELVRPLYFPGNPAGKKASHDGPDVLAVKRAVWRGGRWTGPASSFDDSYSWAFALGKSGNVAETGLAGFQRQMKLDPSGQMGDKTYQALRYARVPYPFPHADEPLFDAYAVELLEEAANPPAPTIGDVRSMIADYCRRCIAKEPIWHYEQIRPMTHLGRSPEDGGSCDCSSHSTGAYFWAKAPDPNHRGYDGYGYTGTLVNNPRVSSSSYQIGDLALYGDSESSTEHVATCYIAGDASSSRWCSHGSEAAPYTVELRYRADLLLVVRPALA